MLSRRDFVKGSTLLLPAYYLMHGTGTYARAPGDAPADSGHVNTTGNPGTITAAMRANGGYTLKLSPSGGPYGDLVIDAGKPSALSPRWIVVRSSGPIGSVARFRRII